MFKFLSLLVCLVGTMLCMVSMVTPDYGNILLIAGGFLVGVGSQLDN